MTTRLFFAELLAIVSNGRIMTKTARARKAELDEAWKKHAEEIQKELDAERERGWGWVNGRRYDFK